MSVVTIHYCIYGVVLSSKDKIEDTSEFIRESIRESGVIDEDEVNDILYDDWMNESDDRDIQLVSDNYSDERLAIGKVIFSFEDNDDHGSSEINQLSKEEEKKVESELKSLCNIDKEPKYHIFTAYY